MKDTIRIIHMGDLHLDSPFSSLGVDKSEIRRRELRATFTSIMYAEVERIAEANIAAARTADIITLNVFFIAFSLFVY